MIHEAVPQKELEHRIIVRRPETIYRAEGLIENGSFHGRWHFSFDRYEDAGHERFGVLRVFNDDTLSPGAVWPLHPHHEIEVVTCCAAGEFRHADENGQGGILKQGWVQHTTVGGDTLARCVLGMKSFGRMVAIVPVTGDLDACRRRNITLHFLMVSPARRKLDRLRALLDEGRIRPVIDSRMSRRDVARAHERLEKGGVRGKIILDVAGAS